MDYKDNVTKEVLLESYSDIFDLDDGSDEKSDGEILYEEMLEDEIFFDEEIREAMKRTDPFWLNKYLGISLEKASEICEELSLRHKISLRNLKTIMFARDRKVLDIKIDKVTPIDLTSEDLDEELDFFNKEMLKQNNFAVKVEGKNSDGKRVVLYYYPGSYIRDRYDIHRQMRVYNEFDDVEAFQEQIVFSDGVISDSTCALVAYGYDDNGNKKYALYDDEVYGGRYFEYDENEKMVYLITETSWRNVSEEMIGKLLDAFETPRPDFQDMDNSRLEEHIDFFSGEEHKKVEREDRYYGDR